MAQLDSLKKSLYVLVAFVILQFHFFNDFKMAEIDLIIIYMAQVIYK